LEQYDGQIFILTDTNRSGLRPENNTLIEMYSISYWKYQLTE